MNASSKSSVSSGLLTLAIDPDVNTTLPFRFVTISNSSDIPLGLGGGESALFCYGCNSNGLLLLNILFAVPSKLSWLLVGDEDSIGRMFVILVGV